MVLTWFADDEQYAIDNDEDHDDQIEHEVVHASEAQVPLQPVSVDGIIGIVTRGNNVMDQE